ncbi:hypothetical protein [Kingella kingae]|uniref:hypothetical protein n=1 Tax=Kingella kingae TaxID=504 RepID=UPI00040549C1|nr:hypothetical protein [Kingella kingae]
MLLVFQFGLNYGFKKRFIAALFPKFLNPAAPLMAQYGILTVSFVVIANVLATDLYRQSEGVGSVVECGQTPDVAQSHLRFDFYWIGNRIVAGDCAGCFHFTKLSLNNDFPLE